MEPDLALIEIHRKREEINRIVQLAFADVGPVFQNISLQIPRFKPAELGFIRMTSWLYVHYYETGRAPVRFLLRMFPIYKGNTCVNSSGHYSRVDHLRTYLQHNLDPTHQRDEKIAQKCENWFRSVCGSAVPAEDFHWENLLNELSREALIFFDGLLVTIRGIETDESTDAIQREWRECVNREHPPHVFDPLIEMVARDMGRESLDLVRLRKAHYQDWVTHFRGLNWPYDFEVEARKLIEETILTRTAKLLPITGQDIMKEFGVPPGPDVGALLGKARMIYESRPSCKAELLQRLRDQEHVCPQPQQGKSDCGAEESQR